MRWSPIKITYTLLAASLIILTCFTLITLIIEGKLSPFQVKWSSFWDYWAVIIGGVAAIGALAQLEAHHAAQRSLDRPYVIVTFSFQGPRLYLKIANTGRTPARDITFTWSTPPRGMEDDSNKAMKKTLVEQGITHLAPGETIYFPMGLTKEYLDNPLHRRYEVIASYRDIQQTSFGKDEKMVLDLTQWAESEDYYDPLYKLADTVHRIANTLEDMRSGAPKDNSPRPPEEAELP
ncbi:hypothetical protein [uncultured Actinomyces sp.]|jgi:hypothetical protein|uniref:hypothetical protein n=1 Tax=uncultured Actinomyces sp. TaxID=249061 RepID=UPI00262AA886|nr:hypothetical protein [uncultured Actinomyces sp.]